MKFGGCKESFLWLGHKVNKEADANGHDASDPCMDLCADDATSRQDISTPFSILIEFEATQYSYFIGIRNFKDIRFDI